MSIYLNGVGARFYRGIGHEPQLVGPFKKMNFFVGSNNSGKSIILNLIAERIKGESNRGVNNTLKPEERHTGPHSGEFVSVIGLSTQHVLDNLNKYQFPIDTGQYLTKIVTQLSVEGLVWTKAGTQVFFPDPDRQEVKKWLPDKRFWQHVWSALTQQGDGGIDQHWIPETLAAIASASSPSLPGVHLIPAKRQLGPTGDDLADNSGRGLIDHLARLQAPSFES